MPGGSQDMERGTAKHQQSANNGMNPREANEAPAAAKSTTPSSGKKKNTAKSVQMQQAVAADNTTTTTSSPARMEKASVSIGNDESIATTPDIVEEKVPVQPATTSELI